MDNVYTPRAVGVVLTLDSLFYCFADILSELEQQQYNKQHVKGGIFCVPVISCRMNLEKSCPRSVFNEQRCTTTSLMLA